MANGIWQRVPASRGHGLVPFSGTLQIVQNRGSPQAGTVLLLALFREGRGPQCLEKELLKGEQVRKDQNPQGPHLTRECPPPIPGRSSHSCLPVECSHDAEA